VSFRRRRSGSSPDTEANRSSLIEVATVEAAQRGDEAALTELVTLAYPLVRRWTAAHGSDAADVDDTTQEVIVSVLKRLRSFRGDASFTTWLYRVTRNAWLDRAKARRRAERRGDLPGPKDEAALAAMSEAREGPSDTMERQDARERIERAFRALPPRQREVFDLADVQGFSAPEIARMLGVAPSSVRVSLLKARRALRSKLLELDPDFSEEVSP
jgi:RNA polymerase sigma-70 factor (ECF subfamily)